MWLWLANATSVDPKDLDAAIGPIPEVRVALAPEDVDIDGFRRSHLDAIKTQRLLQRLSDLRIARFTEVQLVALVAGDQMREHSSRIATRCSTASSGSSACCRSTSTTTASK